MALFMNFHFDLECLRKIQLLDILIVRYIMAYILTAYLLSLSNVVK